MVGTCGTWCGEQKCIQDFGGENLMRDNFEDLEIDVGNKINMDPKAVGWVGVNWIQLA
jgi:hypothetical protein